MERSRPKPLPPPDPALAKRLAREAIMKAQRSSRPPKPKPVDDLTR